MSPLLAIVLSVSAAVAAWTTTVPFTPGRSMNLDARAGSLLVSNLEMTDRSDTRRTAVTLTLTAANVGDEDAEVHFTATLLDAQGGTLAVEDESMEIEEGDVKKVRFRVTLPEGKHGPIASVNLTLTED